jgi:hypothetical protein
MFKRLLIVMRSVVEGSARTKKREQRRTFAQSGAQRLPISVMKKSEEIRKTKGLAEAKPLNLWLPDLDSNQGPAD